MSTNEARYEPPKRNRTAYNMFYQAARKRILESIPDPPTLKISKGRRTKKPTGKISFEALARRAGEEWKSLSEEDKKVYTELARKDKERYAREKKMWLESIAELEREHASQPPDYSMLKLPEKAPPKKAKKIV